MDRNTIYGLILIFLVLIGYTWWMSPSKEENALEQRKKDSIALVQKKSAEALKNTNAAIQSKKEIKTVSDGVTAQSDTLVPQPATGKFGMFTEASRGVEKNIVLESELLRLTVSNKGGSIRSAELKKFKTSDKKPLILFKSDTGILSLRLHPVNSTSLFFEPIMPARAGQRGDTLMVSGNDSLTLLMRLYPNSSDSLPDRSQYIEYAYTLKGNNYMTGFGVRLVGMRNMLDSLAVDYLTLDWNANLRQQEKSFENERNASTIYYRYFEKDVDYLSETKDDEESLVTKVKWISFKQQFFASTLIATNGFEKADLKVSTEGRGDRYLKSLSASLNARINFNDSIHSLPMSFYFGPNKYKTYRAYKLDLERQIPLGWSFPHFLAWINQYAVIPVFDFLERFGMNYGIIILILTILLKIVLFPIGYKTYISSARMRVLKPEIDEIAQKFPDKNDALKKQQATMALYKKAGVNPLSGCLPMLLQMPILIALFRFFPASIELRQKPFLWADDLSAFDSVLDLPFRIPGYGDHVSLFCLLMTISTIIYTKISNDMMSSGQQQMPGMKLMMYLMPVMFLGFFNSYSSGLSYYYLLANIFTFIQMFGFRYFVNEEKIHAQIQENKKRPIKKSNFQKRLEEMANQQKRGASPPPRKRK